MKRVIGTILFAAFVVTAPLAANSHAADVEIPDKNLRTVLRKIMTVKQIAEDQPITIELMQKVYFLHANDKDITDLTGLQHCKNLQEVRLANNKIKNLQPIAGCTKLQSLDLTNNQITDIAPLKDMAKLQYLKLDDNQVDSIEPVKSMKALTTLYFDRNNVASLKPVAELPKLHTVYAAENRLTDISPLSRLKWLAKLDVSSNKVTDIRPLAGLTELRFTFLQQNKIEDIAPLVEMARRDAKGDQRFAPFWRLYLGKNPLSEQSKSRHLDSLKTIGVKLDMKYLRKRPAAAAK